MTQLKYKSDIAFYKAFKSAKKQHQNTAAFHFFASLEFLALIIIIDYCSVSEQTYSVVRYAFVLRFIANSFLLFIHLAQICQIYGNSNLFMMLANETSHALVDQPTINFKSIDQCVSPNVFIARNKIFESALNQIQKSGYILQAKVALNQSLQNKAMWIKGCYGLSSVINWFPPIYSIYKFLSVQMTEKIVLLFYFFASLTGILSCVYRICKCISTARTFFSNPFQIKLPEVETTSSDNIIAGGSQCSICFQSIAEKDKVFVLQCSNQHVFHAGCLREWTKVSATCPICRHQIPMDFNQCVQL